MSLKAIFAAFQRSQEGTNGDEESLLTFDEDDRWSVGEAFEGTQIFGATGSGKTSGSGKEIALSMLDAKFGGLVLTVKPDERDTWMKYANHTGRGSDVITFGPRISPERPHDFNFLEYEARRARRTGGNLTENLVAVFTAVMEIAQRGSKSGGQDAYWQLTMKQLLKNAIDLLRFAREPLTFRNIHRAISSAPQTPEIALGSLWKAESFCWRCLDQVADMSDADGDFEDALLTYTYWMQEYPGLAPETRSIIVSVFTSMADCFLRGLLKDLFSPTVSRKEFSPELSHDGKILIIDLPVKTFYEAGQFAQVLYKYIWQRAAESRSDRSRPIFLWADEAQFFVNSRDMLFQTTARSARTATVYLTQSISNYYAVMPGEAGKAETDALMANLRTKIFHANEDAVTNRWASDLIGKTMDLRLSRSSSVSSADGQREGAGTQFTSSQQETMDYQVQPITFTTLRQGGPVNNMTVEAIVTKGGKTWSNDKNWRRVEFEQRPLPAKTSTGAAE